MKKIIQFFKQDCKWYADVPEHSLMDNEMVLGSDEFLEKVSDGYDKINLGLSTEEPETYLVKMTMVSHDDDGAEYLISGELIDNMEYVGYNIPMTVWICNVTHTVFGEHPEKIYITDIKRM